MGIKSLEGPSGPQKEVKTGMMRGPTNTSNLEKEFTTAQKTKHQKKGKAGLVKTGPCR